MYSGVLEVQGFKVEGCENPALYRRARVSGL